MNYIKSILVLFGFILLRDLSFEIAGMFTNSGILKNVLYPVILIFIFIIIYKKGLLEELKNFKINKKYLIISIGFTILSIITRYILLSILHFDASNNSIAISDIKNNFLIESLYTVILIPIVEEFIFRYPFKNNNTFISFIIYTIIFAGVHISNTRELLYLIPYTFMSLGISLQYYKNNNIFTSILYHMFNNILNIMLLLF